MFIGLLLFYDHISYAYKLQIVLWTYRKNDLMNTFKINVLNNIITVITYLQIIACTRVCTY